MMKPLSSLTGRIFLASALLTVLWTSIAIYVVNVRVTASAEDELRAGLVQTGAVVEQQRATVSDFFTALARTVADLPKLKAAVDTDDPPTVGPIAAEYRRQLGADMLLVTGRGGRVLASFGHGTSDLQLEALPSVREARAGHESSTFSPRADGVLEVISVPITVDPVARDFVGTLSVGFLLDDALAARLKKLTGSEIAFAAAGRVRASTLPPDQRPALERLLNGEGLSTVSVGGDEYLALLRPLAASPSGSLVAGVVDAPRVREARATDLARPVAVILRSRTDRLRYLRPIQTALGVTGLLALLLAPVLSFAIARSITRPIRAITSTMREMAATGDLTRKVAWPAGRWDEEDARLLARSFNTLTESITRFQREATERERLSALGRLSTVIAHEVRNPLMIIRASLRALERGAMAADDIKEAIADIDGEVTRLNRLVNEVLDFARPIRFDLAVTDVNRVCEQSAAAANADGVGATVHLQLAASLARVVSDGDRLRSALVNILVNARHAVAARASAAEAQAAGAAAASAGAGTPDVVLITSAGGSGRVRIAVRDRGVGIAPDDLPRVFEPYFTTKRTGTGLGLAIARNIIEGLGGTIAVASEPATGTEIRIELPADPPVASHENPDLLIS